MTTIKSEDPRGEKVPTFYLFLLARSEFKTPGHEDMVVNV